MSIVGTNAPTLSDLAKRMGENNQIAKIIEILADSNEILDDMPWVEGNQTSGHKTTIRTGFPAVAWRLFNAGVQPSKSTTKQITDSVGMLESYAEVDKALADLNGNTSDFRLSEDVAFLESMNQEMASTVFYGNAGTDPEKFTGLAPRFDTPSADPDIVGFNILDGAGVGADNTSVWLIGWGPRSCHGIYPKGSSAGLQFEDLGQQTLEDAAGGKYEGYRSHYKWDAGLTLRDWKHVVRIANIDVSNLAGGSAADLIKLMVRAFHRTPPGRSGVRYAFYASRVVHTALHIQAMEKTNVNLTLDNVEGKPVTSLLGIPIRRVDAISDAESAVAGTFGHL